ncbi:MAG: PBP1A family penicillin-binding protein [Vicinamibacterales bacterium]
MAAFLAAIGGGTLAGLLFAYADDLPEISALDEYAPSATTRVVARDDRPIGEFAVQRRVVVGYDDISPLIRRAIIASEDDQFESHFGLSIQRIVVTLAKDFFEGRRAGGSTLTQQLAKNLFLTPEKTWQRKVKEALLAIQLEKRYTKPEIFTFYANTVPFGHGAYGVEAASRLYFNKAAKDVSLEEAALIAGIIQAPARQSPYVDPDAALRRRNYALARMAAVGFITADESLAARQRPIVTAGQPTPEPTVAPYFLEEVRKHLEAKYGSKPLYEGALTVQTTLDVRVQEAANQALDAGLRRIDKIRGYRRPTRNVVDHDATIEGYEDRSWKRGLEPGTVVHAVVTGVSGQRLLTRVGPFAVAVDPAGYKWTNRKIADLGKPGDIVDVRLSTLDEATKTGTALLDQEPLVEGAMLVIQNRTGQVLAMTGGFDFERSKFNRAVQAMRQIGSTFKAFVYTAAIDRGYTPLTRLVDEPVSYSAGPGQPPYAPMNYDRTFMGPLTLRRAVELSRNVPAVRTMEAIGPAPVVDYARRFGLAGPLPPYLSLALGAAEATLLEMTSAFSVFPNQGVRMQPYLVSKVTDRQSDVLEDNHPESNDTIRADTAYIMTSLLRGVVQHGTAAAAKSIDWPLAGKTGTTDDYTDAWMLGFDPEITVGVWVGLDIKKPIGRNQSGAVAALPIWMDFWKAYIAGHEGDPPAEFSAPANIVTLTVDRNSGLELPAGTPGGFQEVFIAGTQPGAVFPRAGGGF